MRSFSIANIIRVDLPSIALVVVGDVDGAFVVVTFRKENKEQFLHHQLVSK